MVESVRKKNTKEKNKQKLISTTIESWLFKKRILVSWVYEMIPTYKCHYVCIYIYIYITNPNNALLSEISLKITVHLLCFIPPKGVSFNDL